jgi:Ni,Fe-hydrogenase I small subunit
MVFVQQEIVPKEGINSTVQNSVSKHETQAIILIEGELSNEKNTSYFNISLHFIVQH